MALCIASMVRGSIAADTDGADYLIWRGVRGGYYRPHRAGYTADRHEAGRYTLAEAKAECAGCDPRDDMRVVPVSEAFSAGRAA